MPTLLSTQLKLSTVSSTLPWKGECDSPLCPPFSWHLLLHRRCHCNAQYSHIFWTNWRCIQFSTSCYLLPWRRQDSSRWSNVHSPTCWSWGWFSWWSCWGVASLNWRQEVYSCWSPSSDYPRGNAAQNVLPVHIFKDFGIDYIWQCNFVFPFILRKDDGWLQRGECNVLDFEVYLFTDSRHLVAGAGFNPLFISHHVFGSVDAMQFILQVLNQQSWFLHACTQSHHSGAHFVFPPCL